MRGPSSRSRMIALALLTGVAGALSWGSSGTPPATATVFGCEDRSACSGLADPASAVASPWADFALSTSAFQLPERSETRPAGGRSSASRHAILSRSPSVEIRSVGQESAAVPRRETGLLGLSAIPANAPPEG